MPIWLIVLIIVILLCSSISFWYISRPTHQENRVTTHQEDRMTKTGETFNERADYHRRGELSPGEHAMAQAIREHLKSQQED